MIAPVTRFSLSSPVDPVITIMMDVIAADIDIARRKPITTMLVVYVPPVSNV